MAKTFLSFEQLSMDPDPQDIKRLYDSGYMGVLPDPTGYKLLRYATRRFYDDFPWAKGIGAGKLITPYKAALVVDPEFGGYERQTTGDCVSHSTRNAGTIDYAADCLFTGATYRRLCTENIYGDRGHSGEGASCDRLASVVLRDTPNGFLMRDKYQGPNGTVVDLSRYNGRIGANWGRSGTPKWLRDIANAQCTASGVYNCKSVEEARDALAIGFGVSGCSNVGFDDVRNKHGFCEAQGTWYHAMSWIGYDDTDWAKQNYGGGCPLDQNSWGAWNRGPTRYDQPVGSFFMRPSVAQRMVRGGGLWVIASVSASQPQEYHQDRASELMRLCA